mmetsp:Transcript_12134/g.36044  ORF Transcript_12134/g.36044 Transcript_12134/m.36044 type:complete len:244 (+) Transcript_12134:699-1430(+)
MGTPRSSSALTRGGGAQTAALTASAAWRRSPLPPRASELRPGDWIPSTSASRPLWRRRRSFSPVRRPAARTPSATSRTLMAPAPPRRSCSRAERSVGRTRSNSGPPPLPRTPIARRARRLRARPRSSWALTLASGTPAAPATASAVPRQSRRLSRGSGRHAVGRTPSSSARTTARRCQRRCSGRGGKTAQARPQSCLAATRRSGSRTAASTARAARRRWPPRSPVSAPHRVVPTRWTSATPTS